MAEITPPLNPQEASTLGGSFVYSKSVVSEWLELLVIHDDSKRYLALFAMPKPVKITGRSSSVTNSFVNGLIPVIAPTAEEVKTALDVLGMGDQVRCSYCGDQSTEWDHLRPLVVSQRPTGYISEIYNLVPACGKCNQSKGNKDWKTWMLSSARLSPTSRGIPDIERRIGRLEAFEAWGKPTKVDFEAIVSPELWATHWENHSRVLQTMRDAETVAAQIRAEIAAASDAMHQPTS